MRTPKALRLPALACAGVMLATATAPAALAVSGTSTVTIADPDRGTIVSAKRIAHLSAREVTAYLRKYGSPVPPHARAADLYAVTYRTPGVDGRPSTASGVVALPAKAGKDLWTVAYEHGTLATRRYAGSLSDGDGRAVPLMFAAAGFAAAAPDYLGLGTGPGHHPYMDTATETSASLDMLRAAQDLAGRKGHTLSGDVLVTGFSQGAVAAMALGRELQANPEPGLRLRGLAPISGPYDGQHAEMPELLAGHLDPHIATYYLAYWTTSMNRLYHFYDSPGQAFQDPAVERLFDGDHSFEQIAAGLPASPRDLLTPAFLDRFERLSGPVLYALQANDTTCSDWRPEVPVRLFATRHDREVAVLNSKHCLRDLRANGARVSLTDVGDVDHMTSPRRSMPIVLRWFTGLR